MPSQRYTRWRTTDEEYEEDIEENGELTEPRDTEESESRRAFTLMTPSRETADPYQTLFSKKFLLITILLCIFCLFGGAFMGFYVGYSHHIDHPWHQDVTAAPEVKPTPALSTLCDHPDSFEDIPAMSMKLLQLMSIYDIKKHVTKLTNGEPDDISDYIVSKLQSYGYEVKQLVYFATTSYHQSDSPSTVSVLYQNGTLSIISNSSRTDSQNRSFTSFNGYSANGTFSGPVIYGYFAREQDFAILKANNISLNNSILLVRQGKFHPSIQVRNAEKFGVKAVLLYPDPEDFGFNSNTSEPYGKPLPEDGVITQNLRIATGDPATVGYTSESHVYRLPADKFTDIPKIPVQSISVAEAKLIFSTLQGPSAPNTWKGVANAGNTFGGSFKPELNITSISVSVFSDIGSSTFKSIHGYLPSEDDTKVIHVGTHFDESVDRLPTSAISIAAWLAFAETLHSAFPNGTRRMLMFSAFPGTRGDYSGGGEFAEIMSNWLFTTAIAYVDFDDMLKGAGFLEARASPLMKEVIKNAYHHVEWPGKYNTSVFHGLLDARKELEKDPSFQYADLDEMKEASMCGESANFYAMRGIPTLNLAAVDIRQRKFNLKNSQYDELYSGTELLDPQLEWTYMITALLSVSSIILANKPLPPVDFKYYARHLNNEWSMFVHEHRTFMNTYNKSDLNDTIDAIDGELDILITVFNRLDSWYSDESATVEIKSYRKREESLMHLIMVSRHFLRPESVPSPVKGGSLLTFGPDVENSCQGVPFPMARKVLYDIKQNASTWSEFKQELSLILSSVSSFVTKIGSNS